MVDVNPDTVRRLIALARAVHAKEAVVIPEDASNPSGDWGAQVLASHADDLSAAEFLSIVEDLEPDQQQQLVAMMWLGRGDFVADEWDAAVEQAEDMWREGTGDYLLSHPLLSDELEAALEELGYEAESS
jgi:hypothetical protein